MKKIIFGISLGLAIQNNSLKSIGMCEKEVYIVKALEPGESTLSIESRSLLGDEELTIFYIAKNEESVNSLFSFKKLEDAKHKNLINKDIENLKFLKSSFEYNFGDLKGKNKKDVLNTRQCNLYEGVNIKFVANMKIDGVTCLNCWKLNFEVDNVKISRSGVKIENSTEGVFLSKNNKKIELSIALKNYYEISKNSNQLADSIAQSSFRNRSYSGKLLDPILNRINKGMLIKDSKILAVCGLIDEKDKEGKTNSRIMVLAHNKDDGLFHWTTKLDGDIGILLQDVD